MTTDPMDTGCQPQAHGQADPGGGSCPRCSRPRCTAAAKSRPGERCRKNPHPGASICTNHGLTEAGRAKAAERLQEEAADRLLAKLHNPNAAPVKDPVSALEQRAGSQNDTLDALGEMVNRWVEQVEVCGECGRPPSDPPPVLLAAFQRQDRQHSQTLVDMARLGIASRAVEVQQGQADQMLGWLRSGLEAGAAAGVPQVGLQVVLDGFLEAMRRSRVVTVAGELESGAAS